MANVLDVRDSFETCETEDEVDERLREYVDDGTFRDWMTGFADLRKSEIHSREGMLFMIIIIIIIMLVDYNILYVIIILIQYIHIN